MCNEDNGQKLEQLALEIAQLKDLFARRLMEDKAKNRLLELVQEQNATLNKQLEQRTLTDIFREMVLVCDRIEAQEKAEDASLLASILDEILEVFARREIAQIPPADFFDPEIHNAAETVPATPEYPAGSIVELRRKGYTIKNRLLRPAEVVVAIDPKQ